MHAACTLPDPMWRSTTMQQPPTSQRSVGVLGTMAVPVPRTAAADWPVERDAGGCWLQIKALTAAAGVGGGGWG